MAAPQELHASVEATLLRARQRMAQRRARQSAADEVRGPAAVRPRHRPKPASAADIEQVAQEQRAQSEALSRRMAVLRRQRSDLEVEAKRLQRHCDALEQEVELVATAIRLAARRGRDLERHAASFEQELRAVLEERRRVAETVLQTQDACARISHRLRGWG